MSGGAGLVAVAIGCLDRHRVALCVIGIMRWFSWESVAFHGALDGAGARFSEAAVSLFV